MTEDIIPIEAPEAKPAKPPREKKRGIGTVIKEAVMKGATNEEALAAAKAEFPLAGTTVATVSWYRNKLRKDGFEVPTSRELTKAAKAAAAEVPVVASPVEASEGSAEVDVPSNDDVELPDDPLA